MAEEKQMPTQITFSDLFEFEDAANAEEDLDEIEDEEDEMNMGGLTKFS